ncbi:MAG: DUF962 domain-containing protein [Kordiimonadaceae bacterium]|nr:DUF962 domain-containing protein [Kordiimonadaceae bacterium]
MRNWFYEQMAMYTAYHMDWRNKLTHQIGVPMIVFSLFILASTVQVATLEVGPLTLAAVLMAGLVLFYIAAVPLIGTLAALIYGLLLFYAEQIGRLEMPLVWQAFGVFFVGGWAIQFTGHFYEGRKPALFDNILQIFMAPAFLIAEILFIVKLEQRLKKEIDARVYKYERSSETRSNQ